MLTAVVTGSGDSLEVTFLGDQSVVGQAFVAADEEKKSSRTT